MLYNKQNVFKTDVFLCFFSFHSYPVQICILHIQTLVIDTVVFSIYRHSIIIEIKSYEIRYATKCISWKSLNVDIITAYTTFLHRIDDPATVLVAVYKDYLYQGQDVETLLPQDIEWRSSAKNDMTSLLYLYWLAWIDVNLPAPFDDLIWKTFSTSKSNKTLHRQKSHAPRTFCMRISQFITHQTSRMCSQVQLIMIDKLR